MRQVSKVVSTSFLLILKDEVNNVWIMKSFCLVLKCTKYIWWNLTIGTFKRFNGRRDSRFPDTHFTQTQITATKHKHLINSQTPWWHNNANVKGKKELDAAYFHHSSVNHLSLTQREEEGCVGWERYTNRERERAGVWGWSLHSSPGDEPRTFCTVCGGIENIQQFLRNLTLLSASVHLLSQVSAFTTVCSWLILSMSAHQSVC